MRRLVQANARIENTEDILAGLGVIYRAAERELQRAATEEVMP